MTTQVNKFLVLILFILLLFINFSCKNESTPETQEERKLPGFIHVVYFYLHDSLSVADKENFGKAMDSLSIIPSISEIYFGPPAGTPDMRVDNNYDYAFITLFESQEEHDAYQTHPLHVEIKKRYAPMIKDIKVYDNLVTVRQ